MISEKDAEIISHLRGNARKKITRIAQHTNIPVTTIYDKVRIHEKRFFKRHVTLLDFQKLGLLSHAALAIKVDRERREDLRKFLFAHTNINSLYRTNMGYDFLAETVFRNPAELQAFIDDLEANYKTNEIKNFTFIEELKREQFLTDPKHREVLL